MLFPGSQIVRCPTEGTCLLERVNQKVMVGDHVCHEVEAKVEVWHLRAVGLGYGGLGHRLCDWLCLPESPSMAKLLCSYSMELLSSMAPARAAVPRALPCAWGPVTTRDATRSPLTLGSVMLKFCTGLIGGESTTLVVYGSFGRHPCS